MAEGWQFAPSPRPRTSSTDLECDHRHCSTDLECGHQQLVIGDQHWPLRLIDIPATLACLGGIIFTAKQDWNFHVISHTWSLSIRQFSEKVGQSLRSSTSLEAIDDDPYDPVPRVQDFDLYSQAFGRANFSAEDGYKDLMGFLSILLEDGVQNVWFDALCINQLDDEEKGREIMHMGAYYRYSKGCYVVNHGIGQGYHLLGSDKARNEVYCLPRWFTRVWTLQEFLLPTNLMFLVSGLRTDVISRINEQIKKYTHAVGFCNCCLWGEWTLFFCGCCKLPYWQCPNRRQSANDDDNGEEVLGSDQDDNQLVMCMKCRSLPLIRKAKGRRDECGQLYFIERSTYQRVVSLHFAGKSRLRGPENNVVGTSRVQQQQIATVSNQSVIKPLPHFNLKNWELHFFQLYRLLASKCFACNAMQFAALVQSRQCSEKHKEDRVLSVLCLSGLEGSMQVRAGRTLEQQWAEVAQALLAKGQQRQLLDLCIQNVKFSWHPNSSWIPNYCEFENGCWLSMIRLRSERIQVMEATKEGALKMQGMVVPGRLIRQGLKWKEHRSSHPLARVYCSSCQHFSSLHKTWSRVHQQAMCHLELVGPTNQLSLPLVANTLIEEKNIGTSMARRHACIIQSYPYSSRVEACLDCDQLYEGALYLPLTCMHGLLPLDVFLVLCGESLHERHGSVLGGHSFGEQPSSVVMVCVGRLGMDSGHQLHKIGVLDLPSDVTNAIFSTRNSSSSAELQDFLVGGFGTDVLNIWDTLVRMYSIECGAYPSKKQGLLPVPEEVIQDRSTVDVIMKLVSGLVESYATIL